MSIEDQLKSRIIDKYGSINSFAKQCNLPATTIYSVIQRGIKKAGIGTVIRIFDVLNLEVKSIDDGVLTETTNRSTDNENTPEEKSVIKKYRTLDEYGKDAVNCILDVEYRRVTEVPEANNIIKIDSYLPPVSAGTGCITIEGAEKDQISVIANRYTKMADFVVTVRGNSMEPRFKDNDKLLIQKTDDLDFGDIGIFWMDGKTYVKQIGYGELISLNQEYDPIKIDADSICAQGKVIGVLDPAWIMC